MDRLHLAHVTGGFDEIRTHLPSFSSVACADGGEKLGFDLPLIADRVDHFAAERRLNCAPFTLLSCLKVWTASGFAIFARDSKDAHPIKASHLFLREAESLEWIVPKKQLATDRQGVVRDGLAASTVDRPLLRSWVHDAAVIGCQFSRDELRVLTWSGDNTARLVAVVILVVRPGEWGLR